MAAVILTEVKKALSIGEADTSFDVDVTMHLNTAFSVLNDLGVGPEEGFAIVEGTETWDDLDLPPMQLSKVKSYTYLKTRMLFDPPATSFHIEAINTQIQEMEWRLNVNREDILRPLEEEVVEEEV